MELLVNGFFAFYKVSVSFGRHVFPQSKAIVGIALGNKKLFNSNRQMLYVFWRDLRQKTHASAQH